MRRIATEVFWWQDFEIRRSPPSGRVDLAGSGIEIGRGLCPELAVSARLIRLCVRNDLSIIRAAGSFRFHILRRNKSESIIGLAGAPGHHRRVCRLRRGFHRRTDRGTERHHVEGIGTDVRRS